MNKTKTSLLLIILGTITFGGGLYAYSTLDTLGYFEWAIAAAVFILVLFSIIIGLGKLKKEKAGMTTEDELSKLIREKAAAKSFLYSFYIWTMIIIFTTDTSLDIEVIIGIGVLLMALLFLGIWGYMSKNGIDNYKTTE